MSKQIMRNHDVVFVDRPYGEYWRQVRKLCILELLSLKRVQSFRFVREEEIGHLIMVIKRSCSLGEEVNLSENILTVTNNIIFRVAMSKSLGKSVYAKLSKETLDLFGGSSAEDMFPPLRWIDVLTGLDRRMKKTSKLLLQFYDEVIEERLIARKAKDQQDGSRDFVDILLDHENDSTLSGVQFTRENLKAVLMNMFVAGTDTTYTTVEWAMAELVNHPEVMNKVQEEVRSVVGTNPKVDEDEIKHMSYLICVIKETMRLHPPLVLNLPRVSIKRTTIGGCHIPARTTAIVNSWAIARDPSVWEKPDDFIPERFINNPVDFRGLDFEFIPFGAGRRGCPGISLGMNSVETILANLLCWFDWELPGGENKKNIDTTEIFGLIVRLKFPLCVVPKSYHI